MQGVETCPVSSASPVGKSMTLRRKLTGVRGGRSVTLHSVPSSFAFRFSCLLRRYIIGVQLIMGGGIDPSPTRDLKVSGNILASSAMKQPACDLSLTRRLVQARRRKISSETRRSIASLKSQQRLHQEPVRLRAMSM